MKKYLVRLKVDHINPNVHKKWHSTYQVGRIVSAKNSEEAQKVAVQIETPMGTETKKHHTINIISCEVFQ